VDQLPLGAFQPQDVDRGSARQFDPGQGGNGFGVARGGFA